jgi:hypothetical protein
MPKFRKRPVEVEAVQFIDSPESLSEILDWAGKAVVVDRLLSGRAHLYVRTAEGTMHVSLGDWVIKGVAGEFYPCKPDIFARTYERADKAEQSAMNNSSGTAYVGLSDEALAAIQSICEGHTDRITNIEIEWARDPKSGKYIPARACTTAVRR